MGVFPTRWLRGTYARNADQSLEYRWRQAHLAGLRLRLLETYSVLRLLLFDEERNWRQGQYTRRRYHPQVLTG